MPKPVIDKEKCTKCGACVNACPVNVLVKENDEIIVKSPENCIGCRACEASCEQEAIKVED